MLTFKFRIGGYFGRYHYIYIDGRKEEKKLKYGRTEGGIRIDLSKEYINYDEDPLVYYKEINIVEEVFKDFIEELYLINIGSWEDNYHDSKIYDGTQWAVEIEPKEGNKIEKGGTNKYPYNWRKLISLLNEYTCERIG